MYCGYGVGQCRCCGVRPEGERREWKRGKYLCATGSVLRSTTGYELCATVHEQVFVEAHVLVFSEYGVVGLETVF